MRDSYQYPENYELGRGPEFLQPALEEIKSRVGANSLFFIEDTSVRIDALSSSGPDVPGLAVKEWFGGITFWELDSQLRSLGNNRRATVYSDVALYVPGVEYPIYVQGETHGRVADSPQRLGRSYQHPWLSPDTFNGWFVPEGSNRRLGEMSFEESLEFDFRARSFDELARRIAEFEAIVNLPPRAYQVRRPRPSGRQLTLFGSPPIVVVGRSCAGKTTFGEYLQDVYQYEHLEASEILREVASSVRISEVEPFRMAKALLDSHGPDVVARHLVESRGPALGGKLVISGFRTVEEVMHLRRHCSGCLVVFVEAGERTRFDRHLARGRVESVPTLAEFREQDGKQVLFGLLGRGKDVADYVVENEGSFDQLYLRIDGILGEEIGTAVGMRGEVSRAKVVTSRLYRCLSALSELEGPISPAELRGHVDARSAPEAPKVSARHVNWVLHCHPELAERVEGEGVRYRITRAGASYLEAVAFAAGNRS